MARVLLVVVVVAVAALGGWAGDAQAYVPSSAPYYQTANNSLLTNLLEVPATIPTTGAPTSSGLTYPAAWNEAGGVMTKARVAARLMPALEGLGTIALGASAFTLGWEIGSPLGGFVYDKLAGPSLVAPPAGGWSLFWKWQPSGLTGVASSWSVSGVPDSGWVLCANNGTCYVGWVGATSSFGLGATANAAAASAAASAGATMYEGNNAGTAPNANNNRVYVMTAGQMGAAVTRTPSTATEYATLPHASPYTPPAGAPTSTDLTNARTEIGAPVATYNSTTHVYADGSGNPLTPGQVAAQANANCAMDSSYCAGGANDPFGPGSPLADVFSMPNCVGLSQAACGALLDTAGQTGTRTYTATSLNGADLTKPAGAVVTQPTPASTSVAKSATVTFTVNPSPLPLEIIKPGRNETYDDYVARLTAAGYLGTITVVDLTDTSADPQVGPQAVSRIRVTVGTATVEVPTYPWPYAPPHPSPVPSPAPTPVPAPRVTPTAPLTVVRNPATVPDVTTSTTPGSAPVPIPPGPPATEGPDTPGTGTAVGPSAGSCSCPPLDLTPLTSLDLGSKFPFGVFSWITWALGVFDVTPVTPEVHWPAYFGSAVGFEDYYVHLDWWDPYMGTMRTLLTFFMWVAGIWFVAKKFLHLDWAGEPSDGVDDLL